MEISKAEFIKSSSIYTECPEVSLPEYAFIGRSNVGKSSLINMLTGRKALAKVSSTPGKTQLINHFVIDDSWYLVDLPGYGYAKISQKMRKEFGKLITGYVQNRKELVLLFVLIDIRHKSLKNDLEFLQMLGESGVPFSIIFTKADKMTKVALTKSIENYINILKEDWEEIPRYFVTSSSTGKGKDEVLEYVNSVNIMLDSNQE